MDMGCYEGSDDVITPVVSIAVAKGQAADAIVQISGKTVSGAFPGDFYIMGGVRDVTDNRTRQPMVGAGKRF